MDSTCSNFLVEVAVLRVICMLLHVSGSRIEFLQTIKFAKLSMHFCRTLNCQKGSTNIKPKTIESFTLCIRMSKTYAISESRRYVPACIKALLRTNPMNSHSTWDPKHKDLISRS